MAVIAASAGHPAALLARAGGEARQFGERGSLLGVFADPVIEEVSTVLEPGDSLALYTDGLLEAHAPLRTLMPEQMVEQLERRPPAGAQEAIDALLGLVELDEHVRDDIAILSVRVSPPAGSVAQLPRTPATLSASPGAREDSSQTEGAA